MLSWLCNFTLLLLIAQGLYAAPAPTSLASDLPLLPSWNFDWDDNIMYMPTKIILFEKGTGRELPVTTAEFAGIHDQIGKPGKYENYEIIENDQTGSFRNFRDQPGVNHFLDDIIKNIDSVDPAKWQGPSWKAFQTAMKNPETARLTTIITARGHSRENILAGLRILKDKGFIKNLPPPENIYAVSSPEIMASAKDPSKAKAQIMMSRLDDIQKSGLSPRMVKVLDPDGKVVRTVHLWGFSDDDYGNFRTAAETLAAEVKKGRWPDIKITLFYTGHQAPHQHPFSVVITSDGGFRRPRPGENGESGRVIRMFDKNCDGLLEELNGT